MATKSPVRPSATSSATQPASNPAAGGGLFTPSRYALSQSGGANVGSFGALALRPFPTRIGGEPVEIKIGDVIPAEVTKAWPLPNRRALAATGMVRYFGSEAEAAQAA